MGEQESSCFEGKDPRELPNYTVPEAAHYLDLSQATLRSWLRRSFGNGDQRSFRGKPMIVLPKGEGRSALSFMNLVQTYVLEAVHQAYRIPRQEVGMVLRQIQEERNGPSERRLAHPNWLTLVHSSSVAHGNGQRRVFEAYLCRIDLDKVGLPARLYPFTEKPKREFVAEAPKLVVIDPHVSFGRPVLVGTGIPTAAIAERFKDGESIASLAEDYGRQPSEIEAAIRFALPLEIA